MEILKISNFLLFGEIWNEILSKYYKEVILKLNVFNLLFNETDQRPWPVVSTHELHISAHVLSWAPKSTHEYGDMVPWLLMSADEGSEPHGAMLMTALELSRVVIAAWHQTHER